MGGMGSGSWCRFDNKKTVEAALRVDIRYMRRQGMLKPGWGGQLSWTKRGKKSGEVNYTCHSDHLLLNFRFSENGGEWQLVKQTINFEHMPCRFGGERLWFLCPHCARRCEVLYASPKLFVCRLCAALPYRSQMLGKLERWIDQRESVEEKLWGKERRRWRKPKLERLMSQHQQLDQAIDQTMAQYLNLFQNRAGKR